MTTRQSGPLAPALHGPSRPARRRLPPLEEWGELSLRAMVYLLSVLGLLHLLGLAAAG